MPPQVIAKKSGATFDAFVSYSHAADGQLAPAVRRGLQQLAKPWYQRRALSVFLDKSGLEVTPALWSTIVRALDASSYLVLLASPGAAASRWVNQEVEHWLAHQGPMAILPVLTAGDWVWDDALGDLNRTHSTAVPPALFGVFSEEPAFLDLRWAAKSEHLDLRNSSFRDGIAQLAAPLHGRPKSELDGEDVRQHRRTRRVAVGAIITLLVLLIAAVIGGVAATRNATVANQQRDLALSRLLAAQATVREPDDPRLAALLSVASRQFGDSYESESGMLSVLEAEKRVVGFFGDAGLGKGSLYRAFSPDGRLLAVPNGETVSIWDVGARRIMNEVPVASGDLTFTSDGKKLIMIGRRQIVSWDLTTNTSSTLFDQVPIVLGAGGGRIAAGFADGSVRLWESNTGRALGSFSGLSGVVGAVAVSPDGSSIAAGVDKLAIVWDTTTGQQRGHITALQARPTGAMAFDPSGQRLAVSAPDKSVDVWNWTNGVEQQLTGGHRAGVQSVSFVAADALISAGTSGDVVRWNLTTGAVTEIPDPTSQVTGVTIGPAGSVIASGGFDGSTAVWQPAGTLAEPAGDPQASVLATDSGGNLQTTISPAGSLTLHSTSAGDRTLSTPTCAAGEATYSADGKRLALACPSGTVQIIDLDQGELAQTLVTPSPSRTESVAYSPDGARLAAELADGTVTVWSTADGHETARYPAEIPLDLDFDGQVVHVAFVDNNTLAYAVFGAVQLRNVATDQLGSKLPTPSGYPVTSMAISRDRGLLAAGSQDGSVTLWNLTATAEPAAVFAGDPARVSAMAFSPDGRTLAVANRIGDLTLWDTAQRARRASLNSFIPTTAAAVNISSTGFYNGALYTAGDGGLKRYSLDVQQWQDQLCRIAGRDLTAQEWQAYVGSDHAQAKVC